MSRIWEGVKWRRTIKVSDDSMRIYTMSLAGKVFRFLFFLREQVLRWWVYIYIPGANVGVKIEIS